MHPGPIAFASLCLTLMACGASDAPKAPTGPRLAMPIDCRIGETCEIQTYVDRDTSHGVSDYLCGPRTNDGHNGVDFRLLDLAAETKGVNVLAAADGRVARLRDGVADISVNSPDAPITAGQECGNGVVLDHGDGWETQYCHLARGSVAVKVGEAIKAGQPIARVGLSGNTEFAHLHMTVRHDQVVVDPFAPDPYGKDCTVQPTLWTDQAVQQLAYKAGAVLNAGFTTSPPSLATVEAGGLAAPDREAPILVAYARAIGLERGDVQSLTLIGPDGESLAVSKLPPLEGATAQYMMFVGKKRPQSGWPKGDYTATYTVSRGGRPAMARSWRLDL